MTFEEIKEELNNADDEPFTYKLMQESIMTFRDWFAGQALTGMDVDEAAPDRSAG